MDKKKLTPSLRFKGFTDAWEQRELGDICLVYTGGEAPQQSLHSPEPQGKFKYPIYSNGLGDDALWGYSNEYRFDVPAITFSSIGTLGHPEVRSPYFTPIIRLKTIIPKGKCNLTFLKESIEESDFNFNASGIPNINAKTVKSIIISFTPNIEEQDSIGRTFEALDSLITLHQRKYEDLQNAKKSLLQKMFPENNSDKPSLRFKGFTDAWEQEKLGKALFYEQPTKYIVTSNKYSDSGRIPVLTAGQTLLLGFTDEQFSIKEASRNNPVIIFDDFTTSSHYIDFNFKIKSSAMKLLSTEPSIFNSYFCYCILQNINYIPATHNRHWISIFSDMVEMFPNIEEQNKIAKILMNIDSLITLHQRKYEKLQNIKKSLLERMFI